MTFKASSLKSSRAPSPTPRFQGPASGAEEVLKSQTVGLVHLSDFRKRQAEALEQNDSNFISTNFASSSTSFDGKSEGDTKVTITTRDNGTSALVSAVEGFAKTKKRKLAVKSKLSFDVEDEEETQGNGSAAADPKPREQSSSGLGYQKARTTSPISSEASENSEVEKTRRLGPDKTLSVAPKIMTKSVLLHEAQTREKLRKDFLTLQEAVRNTEVIVPFVFYDGTNIPGGKCKVRKGDFVWVLLDRGRRVGAGIGSNEGEKNSSRREWARIGVDDLMLVRGDVIIPHHYELYYFIVNKTEGPGSKRLFDYSDSAPTPRGTDSPPLDQPQGGLSRPFDKADELNLKPTDLESLEGTNDDPTFTKVVDRRWYERNKHIYPASIWQVFDPAKDYRTDMRRDAQGNPYYFG